jgi:thymidylate synthase
MLKTITKHAKTINDELHDENQYLNLIKDIINEGSLIEGRNGSTLAVFGSAMHFSLENNVVPLLTTKKIAWKTCLKELLWFIRGSTNNEELQKQSVKIWNDNASRDFLDSRGLHHLKENDLGPVYGHQWRFFNAEYTDCHTDYTGKGVDQLKYIIDNLKHPTNRYSRRLVMSAWNPCQLDQMALPPCHVLAQFNVINNKLSCSLYQRSGDVGLGVPFNIASYSFLTHLLAKHCDLEASDFNYYLGNTHIYDDHIHELKSQLSRKPYTFPTLMIKNTYDDINKYTIDDFDVFEYTYHDVIKMKMRK